MENRAANLSIFLKKTIFLLKVALFYIKNNVKNSFYRLPQ
jgi:hypothetical protein